MSEADAIPLLESAEVIGGYRMPYGSNYTFMVHLDAGEGKCIRAIYKPRDGERPLYDYPSGTLYQRERATFVLSRALGWPKVPYTLVREGPYGIGSMQMYIDCDPDITYFSLIEENAEELAKFAVFDLVVNNGDRKAGHCIRDDAGRHLEHRPRADLPPAIQIAYSYGGVLGQANPRRAHRRSGRSACRAAVPYREPALHLRRVD